MESLSWEDQVQILASLLPDDLTAVSLTRLSSIEKNRLVRLVQAVKSCYDNPRVGKHQTKPPVSFSLQSD